MVTSYDERGRVEAFLRYTENLGYDAVYYTYNSANQVLSVRVCDPLRQYATWYGYDANGRVNKMWTLLGANGTGLGTGTPSYPTPLTKPNQEDMQYTYDQMGRVEQMRYLPEDVLTRYRYNERSWLDSMFAIDASSPSDTVFKQRLSRDARGHITGQRSLQMGQTAREESYVYDGLDQLVEWSRGGSTVNYSYDIVGNRTSDNEPGTSRSYTFGDMSRPNKLTAMTAGTKTTSYSYDANGAMTEKFLTDGMATLLHHKLTYTQGGLVRQFEEILSTPGSITCVAAGTTLDASKRDWRYRYSATGEREQKRLYYSPHGDACGETHAWTYYLLGAGDEQLAVYNGRQTNEEDECENTGRRVHIYAVEYISPGGVASVVTRPDGTKELNLRDHLGSVRTVVKAGLTVAQYDYKPFGKVDWSVGGTKREGYIGKEEDRESLLGDYGVRKYDADIGRFLSVDKLFQQQPGYSPYHYSANDPVNASDPSGLFMNFIKEGDGIITGEKPAQAQSDEPTKEPTGPSTGVVTYNITGGGAVVYSGSGWETLNWGGDGRINNEPDKPLRNTGGGGGSGRGNDGKEKVDEKSNKKEGTTIVLGVAGLWQIVATYTGAAVMGVAIGMSTVLQGDTRTVDRAEPSEQKSKEIRIALGVRPYLPDFAAQVHALPFNAWGGYMPNTTTPEAYRAAIMALGANPNVTFHFNLSTPNGRVDSGANLYINQYSVTTMEFQTIMTFFRYKTTFYIKSGSIYKPITLP